MSPALDLDLLLKAYAIGVFPMADDRDADEIYWVEPKRRAILPLDGFHLARSLRKTLASGRYETSFNRAFHDVVRQCAAPAADRPGTWINRQIEDAVVRLHALGHAHSIETWADGELVGGLYGLSLGRAFFGESMFSRAPNASKVALAHLVARLRAGGFELLDCQFQTPHLQSLGAIEISGADYSVRLGAALSASGPSAAASGDLSALDALLPDGAPRASTVSGPTSAWRILQALTQTS
ncbi:MAG: leucyl/phenylalanyl-tRNA--protein transferase [Chakrabartia sp.]